MVDIVERIRRVALAGTAIPKPEASAEFRVKGWGKRRGESALIYFIPSHTHPLKQYEKGITETEFRTAYSRLRGESQFDRPWFNRVLAACAKEGGCNFTTIGGLFVLLGEARHERGVYRHSGTT